MTYQPDPNAFIAGWMTQIQAAVPWLVDTTVDSVVIKALRQTTPPDPYPQGWPKPFAVFRLLGHSTADSDYTQTTSNVPGRPNTYRLYYYEVAYKKESDRELEEKRCIDTYAALATVFKPDATISCVPDNDAEIVSVGYQPPTQAGSFVQYGSEIWIGTFIDFAVNESYK